MFPTNGHLVACSSFVIKESYGECQVSLHSSMIISVGQISVCWMVGSQYLST